MAVEINPQEFGKLQAEVAALRKDIDEIAAELKEVVTTLRSIQSTLSEAKGGWKTLMMIGGIAASLGAALAWVFNNVQLKG